MIVHNWGVHKAAILGVAAICVVWTPAIAQPIAVDEIVQQLSRPLTPGAQDTRGFVPARDRMLVFENGVDGGRLPVEQAPVAAPVTAPNRPSDPLAGGGGCTYAPMPFGAILFERNLALLASDQTSDAQLVNIAKALNDPRFGSKSFIIRGHTDTTGSQARNMALSLDRAEAVARRLATLGVALNRLRPIGLGSTILIDPSAPTSFANRRVDICQ